MKCDILQHFLSRNFLPNDDLTIMTTESLNYVPLISKYKVNKDNKKDEQSTKSQLFSANNLLVPL
jgi:hypothetical protein